MLVYPVFTKGEIMSNKDIKKMLEEIEAQKKVIKELEKTIERYSEIMTERQLMRGRR